MNTVPLDAGTLPTNIDYSRKSSRLNLTQPYDWSNRNIDDDVLIHKVLEAYRFHDVATICVVYGLERVHKRLEQINLPAGVRLSLDRMLQNIATGLHDDA